MMYLFKPFALSLFVFALSGCSFVDVQPGAENIILANDESSCKKLGNTTVAVVHEIVWVDRNEETIALELQTLAQNSAAKMGGNAIWPESEIKDGERTFSVYRCDKR